MPPQPAIFLIAEVNKKWFESLPKDLQQILEKDAAAQSLAINPYAVEQVRQAESDFTAKGGELITLAPAEHAQMLKTILSVGPEVSSTNPALAAAYKTIAAAAARTRRSPSQ